MHRDSRLQAVTLRRHGGCALHRRRLRLLARALGALRVALELRQRRLDLLTLRLLLTRPPGVCVRPGERDLEGPMGRARSMLLTPERAGECVWDYWLNGRHWDTRPTRVLSRGITSTCGG